MACSLKAVMEEAHDRKHAFTPHQIAGRLQCALFYGLFLQIGIHTIPQ
jgi:hypothetical protein